MNLPQEIIQYLAEHGIAPHEFSMLMAHVQGNTVPGDGARGVSGTAARGMYPTDTGSDALVGNSVDLTPTQPNGTISMPAGYRSSGNQVLNVTFSILDVQYDPATPFYRNSVVGRMNFGAGGGAHEVEFDIKNGTQLSIVGQSPSLAARLEDSTMAGTPTLVKVAASFGVGGRAARAFNTRTLPPRLVGPGLVLFARVPKFGFAFMPFCDDPAALVPGATLIQFWSYAGNDAAYTVGTLYGPNPPIPLTGQLVATLNGSDFSGARLTEGMKLPQGADLVTLTNQLDTPVVWTPCFTLSI